MQSQVQAKEVQPLKKCNECHDVFSFKPLDKKSECEFGCGNFCDKCIKDHTQTFMCKDCKMVICASMSDTKDNAKCFHCGLKPALDGLGLAASKIKENNEIAKDVLKTCKIISKYLDM